MSEIKSKIGLTPKGAYSSSTTYDYLDYVTNADGTYTSKQANNVGHALTETDWWEHDFISPKMRVNATTKNWEVSYDGGTTYTDTGMPSKGTDAVSPQLKIDSTTFNWMLSTDGGATWTDLGVASKQVTSSASVVQETGTSTTDVMSQKAITDALANNVSVLNAKENSANKQNNLNTDGTGTKFPTVDAVNAELTKKAEKTYVDGELAKKVSKSSVNIYNLDSEKPLQEGYYTLETAIAAVPEDVQKGGLQIKFSDGKNYSSYECISPVWKTDKNYWIDVSNYVCNTITNSQFIHIGSINGLGVYAPATDRHVTDWIPVKKGDVLLKNPSSYTMGYGANFWVFLKKDGTYQTGYNEGMVVFQEDGAVRLCKKIADVNVSYNIISSSIQDFEIFNTKLNRGTGVIINPGGKPYLYNTADTSLCTGFITLPKGIYEFKKPTIGTVEFSGFDKKGFMYDTLTGAKKYTPLSSYTDSVTGIIYILIKIDTNVQLIDLWNNTDTDLLLNLELKLLAKLGDSVEDKPITSHGCHVSSVITSGKVSKFLLYLPFRDRYMGAEIMRDTKYGNLLEHWSFSGFYDTILKNGNLIKDVVGNVTNLTTNSETELAQLIKYDAFNDWVGGHMHGYEKIVTDIDGNDDVTIYIDGVNHSLTEDICTDFNIFDMVAHSQLFKTDLTTVIADVYKRWRVVDGKLHFYNRVIWRINVEIMRAEYSMFCILRKLNGKYLTNRATRNNDTKVWKTEDGWDYGATPIGDYAILANQINPSNDATVQEQWGEYGYLIRQEVFENNKKPNGGMFINTNSGGAYNKMYFDLTGNYLAEAGEVLYSHCCLSVE